MISLTLATIAIAFGIILTGVSWTAPGLVANQPMLYVLTAVALFLFALIAVLWRVATLLQQAVDELRTANTRR